MEKNNYDYYTYIYFRSFTAQNGSTAWGLDYVLLRSNSFLAFYFLSLTKLSSENHFRFDNWIINLEAFFLNPFWGILNPYPYVGGYLAKIKAHTQAPRHSKKAVENHPKIVLRGNRTYDDTTCCLMTFTTQLSVQSNYIVLHPISNLFFRLTTMLYCYNLVLDNKSLIIKSELVIACAAGFLIIHTYHIVPTLCT